MWPLRCLTLTSRRPSLIVSDPVGWGRFARVLAGYPIYCSAVERLYSWCSSKSTRTNWWCSSELRFYSREFSSPSLIIAPRRHARLQLIVQFGSNYRRGKISRNERMTFQIRVRTSGTKICDCHLRSELGWVFFFLLRKVTNVLLLLLRGRYLCSLVAGSRRIGFRILIPFRESFALVSCSSVQKFRGRRMITQSVEEKRTWKGEEKVFGTELEIWRNKLRGSGFSVW